MIIQPVNNICDGIQNRRIYWRLSEVKFLPINNYLDLKTGLNLMLLPRIYVVLDEPFFLRGRKISGLIARAKGLDRIPRDKTIGNLDADYNDDDDDDDDDHQQHDNNVNDECDFLVDDGEEKKLKFEENEEKEGEGEGEGKHIVVLSDFQILENRSPSIIGTIIAPGYIPGETKIFNILKGDKGGGVANGITITWRELKRALSLLCVRSPTTGSTAMLEAPPGSHEDLVEAARIPCTQPTDLDAMLYGYTNGIYVLDHTQESLPDMDMLQLFASPAGRALVVNENQPKGSTLTSCVTSREPSSRSRVQVGCGRTSGSNGNTTVTAPASPPRNRKSSAELYKEAAEILGLTCSMTDSCRCIDCQSNYFDCEEDYGDTRTEVAAGTPILHALSHPLTCTIQ